MQRPTLKEPYFGGLSDRAIVERVQRGSKDAFVVLYERFSGDLARYVRSITGPATGVDVDDVLQSVWTRAWSEVRKAEKDIDFKPWIYRIARNAAIDALKSPSGKRWVPIDQDHDGVPQPPQISERSRQLRELVRRITGLPERQRRAISMFELEGLTYDEVAKRLATSKASAQQLVYRARQAVRRSGALATVPWVWLLRKVRASVHGFSPEGGRGTPPESEPGALLKGGIGTHLKAGLGTGWIKVGAAVMIVGAGSMPALHQLTQDENGSSPASAALAGTQTSSGSEPITPATEPSRPARKESNAVRVETRRNRTNEQRIDRVWNRPPTGSRPKPSDGSSGGSTPTPGGKRPVPQDPESGSQDAVPPAGSSNPSYSSGEQTSNPGASPPLPGAGQGDSQSSQAGSGESPGGADGCEEHGEGKGKAKGKGDHHSADKGNDHDYDCDDDDDGDDNDSGGNSHEGDDG